MTTHTVYFNTTTGGTYYAYPLTQSLASWATYRALLTEAAAPNLGRYTATLNDTYGMSWAVFSGSSQPSSWDLNVAMIDITSDAIQSASTVDPDIVSDARTWFGADSGAKARNIVTVNAADGPTFALAPKLNPGTDIRGITSVTVTVPSGSAITADSFTTNRDRTRCHFDLPGLTVSGSYTVAVKVTTSDSQTITTTCTLRVN
jgi:hypothetical protein